MKAADSNLTLDTVLSIGTKASEVILSLLVVILLGRLLGAEGFGVYAFALAVVSMSSIPTRLGLPQLVIRETASGRATGQWETVVGIWRWSTATSLILGAAVSLLGIAVILLFGYQDHALGITLLIGLLLIPLFSLASLRSAMLRGLHHIGAANITGIVAQPALMIVLLLGFVLLSESLLTPSRAMCLTVVSAFGAFLLGAWIMRRKRPFEVAGVRPRYATRAWISAAWPMAMTQGAHQINRYVDVIILGLLASLADAGIYRIAAQGAILVSLGMVALGLVTAPLFARLHELNDHQKLQNLLRWSSRAALAFSFLVAFGFAVAGKPVLSWLFGEEFEAAWLPLMILSVGHVLSTAIGPTGLILNMTGHERLVIRAVGVAALINIILNLLLIPLFGAVGAAAATATSLVFWKARLWFAAQRELGIRCSAI